jgi:hypothetical protein
VGSRGWGCNSVVDLLPKMQEILVSIPNTEKRKQKIRYRHKESHLKKLIKGYHIDTIIQKVLLKSRKVILSGRIFYR